jgi:hypothetical protein
MVAPSPTQIGAGHRRRSEAGQGAGPGDRRPAAAAALLVAAFFTLTLASSRQASLTWDEPSFLSAGYAYLTQGEFRFNPSHPPLAQDLVAAPLLLLGLRAPAADWAVWGRARNPATAFGRAFVHGSGADPRRIARWGRFPVLLAGSALVAGIFLAGRRLFGPWPALVGTAVAASSPDLIAHSGLATEDLICAATMFAAVAAFHRAAGSRAARDWVICGAVTGLALLSKYTSLLLLPIYLVSFAWLRRRARPGAAAREAAVALAIGVAIAIAVVGAGYNFSFDLGPYVRGLRSIYGDTVTGYRYYLLGRVSDSPWPHYHAVAFALKTPLPILALLAWAAIRAATDRRRREAAVLLLVPAAAIFAASLFDRGNLGVRRVLPAYPFLFTFASLAAAGETRRLARVGIALLVVWCGVEAARAFPHPLSYFHQAAGGIARGPYLLDDSNLDWGQDLPALARWQREHPEARPLRLSYFGTALPAAWGVEAVEMSDEEIDRPRPGWYAVSAHHLVFFRKRRLVTGEGVDWLESFEPAARAGSIWIYRFD